MSTPTTFMGLPNPSVASDANTWGGFLNTCINGFDTLAVASVPTTVTSSGSLAVANGAALIEANATGGSIVLTLPDATVAANKGRRYSVVKIDASGNTVTLQGFGGQTISGAASVILSTQWSIVAVVSDGANWINSDFELVSTPVSVANGGTGDTTLALNGVLYGNGTSPVQVTTAGGANSVLTANSGAPSFSTTPTVTSITTTGGTTTLAGTVTVSGTASFTTANPTFFSSTGSGAVVLATAPTLSALTVTGKITSYNAQATAGNGVAAIVASTSQKSESAADANVLTFTPAAAAGSYRLRFVLSVSAATTAVLGWTATWKDSNGASQTPTNLALTQSGVAAPALTFSQTGAGNFYGEAQIDIDNSATNIVVQFTLTSGTITAKASATIERII